MDFLDGPSPLAIAHRGGAGDAAENSLEAFERCVGLGFRYLETDVHLSRDGEVVAIHDADLARVADRPGRVRDLTWAEISAARIRGTGTIPRLADLLDAFPDACFNVDAKVAEVVGPLAEVLRRTGAERRVCLASFSDRRLARLRVLLPDTATALGPREIGALRLASYVGRRRAGSRRADRCAQVPERVGGRPLVDRRFVETAHRFGLPVHVWTVDDPVAMRRLLSLGVDGIMTDRPETLREVLVADGLWAA